MQTETLDAPMSYAERLESLEVRKGFIISPDKRLSWANTICKYKREKKKDPDYDKSKSMDFGIRTNEEGQMLVVRKK